MSQITPCVNTLCSYSATSAPSVAGVRRSARIVLVGPVAVEAAMRHEPIGRAFGLHFIVRLAERQRLGLREQVRHQQIVLVAERIQRLAKADEVAGHQLACPDE